MTALERSTARLLARPPEARASDVRRVLEGHGWTLVRQRGSHLMFTKAGEQPFSIPLGGKKVKRIYVDQVCYRLNLEPQQ